MLKQIMNADNETGYPGTGIAMTRTYCHGSVGFELRHFMASLEQENYNDDSTMLENAYNMK